MPVWTIFVFLAPEGDSHAQSIEEQIEAEISRLRPLMDTTRAGSKAVRNFTKSAFVNMQKTDEYLKAGSLYLSLARMGAARHGEQAAVYMQNAEKRTAGKGVEGFREETDALQSILENQERAFEDVPRSEVPAIVEAYIEKSRSEAWKHYYLGQHMGAKGLYMFGASKASMDLALFTLGFRFGQIKPPPSLAPLEESLSPFEARVVEAYVDPEFGVEEKKVRYNNFLLANVSIKEARKLDKKRYLFAALLAYLEARKLFAMIEQPEPESETLAKLLERNVALADELAAAEIDHSLGLYLLETARDEGQRAAEDSTAGRKAVVIMEVVLPHYLELTEGAN